ncbi:hypothetical protein JMUB5056_1623 [Leptotrichia hongkongensis]|uniref:Uncharacterized protein n=1 Tax=Leptotrichia hongkongensis TaxID=554406 RepID=A0A510L9L9_9FUSO|nr:hypothetical protein [Leptotrichia hongkongensis]BBM60029.1 hypothetical protein JMUB5056_1623 [Leptotrichia hongkongensis]
MNNKISEQKSIAGLKANAAAFLVNLSFYINWWISHSNFCINFRK